MSRKLEIRSRVRETPRGTGGNPKSETMNDKSESAMSETEVCRFWSFGFVSDFDIRISNLFSAPSSDHIRCR